MRSAPKRRRTLALPWSVAALALMMSQACQCEDDVWNSSPWLIQDEAPQAPRGRLEAPTQLDFGLVARGERVERLVQLRNVGAAALTINGIEPAQGVQVLLEGFGPDALPEALPTTLEAGATLTLRLIYQGHGEPWSGQLLIGLKDDQQPTHRIALTAGASTPCVEVSPSQTVDFGTVALDTPRDREVIISNCSATLPLSLSLLDPSGDDPDAAFSVPQAPRFAQVELEPGQPLRLPVRFVPVQAQRYEQTLLLKTDVPGQERLEVRLVGRGAPPSCPQPVIQAYLGDRLAASAQPTGAFLGSPLDEVRLDSRASRAQAGAEIERVEWTLVRRPQDSAAALARPLVSLENLLWLDLSGEYTVELHVWDSRGQRSCEPARLTLQATPNKDIHLQLVWDTPNDRDQLDNQGADLDLHLLHPRGRWNQRPFDCFWQNERPDWGRPNDPSDDPSLDIDDTDGWGPENINLDNPEDGARYKVGVHYFAHHGFGPSYATLRMYLNGALAAEYRRQRLTDQQFWYVLDVDWPSGQITRVDSVGPTFPR